MAKTTSKICPNNWFWQKADTVWTSDQADQVRERASGALKSSLICEAKTLEIYDYLLDWWGPLQRNGDEVILTDWRQPHRIKPGLSEWFLASHNEAFLKELCFMSQKWKYGFFVPQFGILRYEAKMSTTKITLWGHAKMYVSLLLTDEGQKRTWPWTWTFQRTPTYH